MSISNLFRYAKSITGKVLSKDDLEDELSDICSSIRVDVKPMLSQLMDVSKSKDYKLSDIVFLKGTPLDKNYKSVSALIVKMSIVLDGVLANQNEIVEYMKDMPKKVTTDNLTTNQAVGVNVIDNLRFLVEMSGDILISIAEKYANADKDSVYTTKISTNKKTLLYDYYTIMTGYTNIKSLLVDLDNMVIGSNRDILEASLSNKNVNIISRLEYLQTGFTGNPIYHTRMWLMSGTIGKIKTLEKKKQYIEYLLADLELKQADQYDPALEEVIDNVKAEINAQEEKIEKLSK